MIKAVKVINYNGNVQTGTTEFTLTRPEESGFAIVSIEGLGPEDIQLSKSDYAFIDGAHFDQARIGSREITIQFVFVPDYSRGETIESKRHELYKILKNKDNVKLEFITDRLDVTIEGYVIRNHPEIFSSMEGVEVKVDCMDPYFKAAGNDVFTFVNTTDPEYHDMIAEFEFPFSNELNGRSINTPNIEFGEALPVTHGYEKLIYVNKKSFYNNGIRIHIDFNEGPFINIDADMYKNQKLVISKYLNDGNFIRIGSQMIVDIGKVILDMYTSTTIPANILKSIDICTIPGSKDVCLLIRESDISNKYRLLSYIHDENNDYDNINWFDINDGDCLFGLDENAGGAYLNLNSCKITVERLYDGI